jgi:rhodanese-related sulfurtransferase
MTQKSETQGLKPDAARVEIASDEGGRVGVVDIRPLDEYGEQHVPGSMHCEDADADELEETLRDQDKVERWVVICADGERSRGLASELAERGLEVAYLEGGMDRWVKDKQPIQPPASDQEYEGPKNLSLY